MRAGVSGKIQNTDKGDGRETEAAGAEEAAGGEMREGEAGVGGDVCEQ